MYLISKKGKTIEVYNNINDADFFYKTRYQRHLYKIENSIKEITQEQYYFLLESQTPIFINGFIFANPEPLDFFSSQGKKIALFQGATQKGGIYYQFITTLENIKRLMPFDFIV